MLKLYVNIKVCVLGIYGLNQLSMTLARSLMRQLINSNLLEFPIRTSCVYDEEIKNALEPLFFMMPQFCLKNLDLNIYRKPTTLE
jgi:hypothetical protein